MCPVRRHSAIRTSLTYSPSCEYSENKRFKRRWCRTWARPLPREGNNERQEQISETILTTRFYPDHSDGGCYEARYYYNSSAIHSDLDFRINPGIDGVLALGVAKLHID